MQPQEQMGANLCEAACMQNLVMEELKSCCEQLKPPYNQIAKKYFYQEMSIREIAKELDRKEKTVQTQVYRAKAMLKKLYHTRTALHRLLPPPCADANIKH